MYYTRLGLKALLKVSQGTAAGDAREALAFARE
jgi:hypothetical protein